MPAALIIAYLDKFFSGGEDRIYKAELDGDIIGYISVEVHREQGYCYIDDLSVSKSHRGCGIGTKLIQTAEQYTRECGISKLSLHAESSNEGACRLYERLGYTVLSRENSRLLMGKLLSDA